MKDNRTDFAVPGTDGVLLVRRRPNHCCRVLRSAPKYQYGIVHALTGRVIISLPCKADAVSLAKSLYRKLPRETWSKPDPERVAEAVDAPFRQWVVETVQARMKKMTKGARQ